jgi:plastocyanin
VTARRLPAVLLACLILALIAGCGGGGKKSSSSSSGGGASTSSSSSSSSGSGGGTVTVGMKNIQFNPATVRVKVGQTVKWVNQESVAHNVKAESGASFGSPTFGQDGSFTFTPKKAGTISYVCTIHAPGMAGKLVVTK